MAFTVGEFCFYSGMLLLSMLPLMLVGWNNVISHQQLPTGITATVTAHELHRPPHCRRVVSREEGMFETECWGAHVSFAFIGEEADVRACTIAGAVPELHTRGAAERILLESFPVGSSCNILLDRNNGKCSLDTPKDAKERSLFLRVVNVMLKSMLVLLNLIVTLGFAVMTMVILKEWYPTQFQAWYHCCGGGGAAAGDGKKTDDQPLVASAALP